MGKTHYRPHTRWGTVHDSHKSVHWGVVWEGFLKQWNSGEGRAWICTKELQEDSRVGSAWAGNGRCEGKEVGMSKLHGSRRDCRVGQGGWQDRRQGLGLTQRAGGWVVSLLPSLLHWLWLQTYTSVPYPKKPPCHSSESSFLSPCFCGHFSFLITCPCPPPLT